MGESLTHLALGAHPTGHICADCGQDIVYMEEAVLVQVVQPQLFQDRVLYHHVIDEQDVSGDFLFEPYYFCFECWERIYNEVREEVTDEPPITDPASHLECICCASGIREWEFTGTFTLGEFHASSRSPNGVRGPRFEASGAPDALCLYCLALINDNYIAMWDNLSQFNECIDCLQLRCWRHGECDCECHYRHQLDDE